MDEITKLAISARDGNRIALGAFVQQTQADVWRCCELLGPRDLADDLTQDVYLKMIQSLPRFRGESSARTWLLAIARFTAMDATRSARRRERITTLFRREPVEVAADNSIEVSSLISGLDADQRAAFVMTQLLGLSYAEAATACECAIGTIRSRIARARERLVICIAETEVDMRSDSSI